MRTPKPLTAYSIAFGCLLIALVVIGAAYISRGTVTAQEARCIQETGLYDCGGGK